MAVEGPSDVLCAVEDETARSLCIDNISSSTSEELQEAIWVTANKSCQLLFSIFSKLCLL